jgi:hypothetical protein
VRHGEKLSLSGREDVSFAVIEYHFVLLRHGVLTLGAFIGPPR